MPEFLTSFSLEFAVVIVMILAIVLSAFRNQRKVLRNTICLVVAFAIVGVPLFFNYLKLVDRLVGLLKEYVFPYTANGFQIDTVEFNTLLSIIVILAIAFAIYGILVALCVLIGGTDKRKFRNNPEYETTHRYGWGIFFGIIKGLMFAYLLCILYSFVASAFGIDTSSGLLINLFNKFDPIVDKFKTLITGVLGV